MAWNFPFVTIMSGLQIFSFGSTLDLTFSDHKCSTCIIFHAYEDYPCRLWWDLSCDPFLLPLEWMVKGKHERWSQPPSGSSCFLKQTRLLGKLWEEGKDWYLKEKLLQVCSTETPPPPQWHVHSRVSVFVYSIGICTEWSLRSLQSAVFTYNVYCKGFCKTKHSLENKNLPLKNVSTHHNKNRL